MVQAATSRRRTGAFVPVAACAVFLGGCGGSTGPAPLNVVASLGEVGTSPGQYAYPRALDCDAESLWVIDKTARVQRIDPETGRQIAGWQMPEYKLGRPTGVSVGIGEGGVECVYVPDTHYQRVMIYRVSGEEAKESEAPPLVAQFGAYGTGPGEFIYPTDVAVLPSPDGGGVVRIYVSEYGGNDRVSVFDGAYRFLFSFGRNGSGDGSDGEVEFSRPQSIALDVERSRLVVTDACNHRVGVFTLDGELVRWIGSPDEPGTEPGRFKYPYGLTLLDDGTALVAEFGGHRVQRIDLETGTSLGVFGAPGRTGGFIMNPWGVAVLGRTAYVLDSGNNRVVGFPSPSPRRVAQGGRP